MAAGASSPGNGWLNGVAATSARDVWVVGFSGSAALILHFNGTSWRRVPSPPSSGALLSSMSRQFRRATPGRLALLMAAA